MLYSVYFKWGNRKHFYLIRTEDDKKALDLAVDAANLTLEDIHSQEVEEIYLYNDVFLIHKSD